jgi:hypothetical protein
MLDLLRHGIGARSAEGYRAAEQCAVAIARVQG